MKRQAELTEESIPKKVGRPVTTGKQKSKNVRWIQSPYDKDLLARITKESGVSATGFFRVIAKNAELLIWDELKKEIRKFLATNTQDKLEKIIKTVVLDDVRTVTALQQYMLFADVNPLILVWCLMFREKAVNFTIETYVSMIRRNK